MPMSSKLTRKITQLFSKAEPMDHLGVVLRQGEVTYCYFPENQPAKVDAIELRASNYLQALEQVSAEVSGQCHLILSTEQYQIIQIDRPNVPDEEMHGALKWQVKDQVSFAPDEMVLDYYDGPTLAGGVEKLNVVCASSIALKNFIAPLMNDNIQLKTITTPEFAFANLVPVHNDACLLVCQQPNEEILLLIVKDGQLFFHRRLRGFTHIAQASEQDLSMGLIDSLSLEIQRSTDYFERQLKQAPIKSIQLVLPIHTEAYLAEKLAENTHIPVEILALPEPFSTQPSTWKPYAVAIAASMLSKGLPQFIAEAKEDHAEGVA